MRVDNEERKLLTNSSLLRGIAACALIAGIGVLFSACGSDSSSSSSAESSAGGSETESSSSGGISQESIDWAASYVGSEPGKASGQPIKIGWANQEGGVFGFPGATIAAEQTVSFINDELGGVGGRPLELDVCPVASEEDGQKCGTQFVNDSEVRAYLWGFGVEGNQSYYNVTTQKGPVIVALPAGSPADSRTPNVFSYQASGEGLSSGAAVFIKEKLEATSVGQLCIDNAGGRAGCEAATGTFEELGVPVKDAFYPETATPQQMQSAVSALSGEEVITYSADESKCKPVSDAQQSLASDSALVLAWPCWSPEVKKAFGGSFAPGYYVGFGANPWITEGNPGVAAWSEMMAAAGQSEAPLIGSMEAFNAVMILSNLMNEIGIDNVDGATLSKAAQSFTGPSAIIPDRELECGYNPETPSICGRDVSISLFEDGSWSNVPGFEAFDPAQTE